MSDTVYEPEATHALATCLEDSFFETRRLRKDGWNGQRMADFCRTLAETGIVTFACRTADMSAQSAYALRHRNPLFAKAWEAALALARERLADELLARSLKGSAEQLLREGCIVGERHHYDNKLAFAMLRRLDRRAEVGATFRTPAAWEIPAPAPAIKGQWQDLLDALSEDRTEDAALLLAESKVDSEVDNPPFEGGDSDSLAERDDRPRSPSDRVWHDWQHDEWRTDFPAPRGFDGDEYGSWDDPEGYSRTLTDEELSALAAAGLIDPPPEEVTEEEDAAARDAFFASLSASPLGEVAALDPDPGPTEASPRGGNEI